jgi:hypothetical protein
VIRKGQPQFQKAIRFDRLADCAVEKHVGFTPKSGRLPDRAGELDGLTRCRSRYVGLLRITGGEFCLQYHSLRQPFSELISFKARRQKEWAADPE